MPLSEEDRAAAADRLRPEVHEAYAARGLSKRALARQAKLSPPAVLDFLSGSVTPQEETITKLRSWLRTLNGGSAAPQERPVYAPAPEEQRRVFAEISALGEPGEFSHRKLAAIDKYVGYLTDVKRPVPDWLYTLREKVERGEM